jgi:uncharacterized membrane protein YcaP (DUF421 family)
VDGILAMIILIGLQFLISWMSARSKKFSNIVKSEPTLLFYKGQFMRSSMTKERVTSSEVLEALRSPRPFHRRLQP